METLRVGETIRFAWETFKKRPLFFVGAGLLISLVSVAMSAFAEGVDGNPAAVKVAVEVLVLAVNMLIGMGMLAFFLKANDSIETLSIRDLWHPRPFWKYVGASIIYAIVVGIPAAPFVVGGVVMSAGALMTGSTGLLIAAIALIIFGTVIGVLISLMFMLCVYLVIDRKLGPISALKESARITKGNRMNLFLLMLASIGICLLGLIALVVGLLVAIPVVSIAMARAYRVLETKASAVQTV